MDRTPAKEEESDMTKRELLCAEKTKKFDEICTLIARELGYGDLSRMNRAQRSLI